MSLIGGESQPKAQGAPNNGRPLPGAVGHLVTARNGICVSRPRFLNGPSFVLTYDRGNGNERVGVMDRRTRVQPAVRDADFIQL